MRIFHLPALLLLTSASVTPLLPAKEAQKGPKTEEVDPGRRESERAVKGGVDAELQKDIDRAIEKARDFLLEGCTGSAFTQGRIEELETQARHSRATVEDYRKRAGMNHLALRLRPALSQARLLGHVRA